MAQIVAASLMAVWADQVIHSVGDPVGLGELGLGRWAVPFTVFAVVGVMNAINMIDGMDGLAGGVSAVAIGWLAALAALNANGAQLELLLLWLGAVVGFLLFNLRYPVGKRARVFMGDGGSLVLGLTLAWFCVDLAQDSSAGPAVYPITAVWILGVPIMDTVYLILRRAYRRTSPFAPDRRHIHHTLLVMGLREGWAVFVIVVLSAVYGAVGVLGWYWGVPEPMLWGLFFATFFAYCAVMQHWRIFAGRFLGKRRALELGRNRASGEIQRRRASDGTSDR
jgi:UDP-GlcNAc:undecaprenyl-phosphate GlcNAc-1-phosphate transferase